MNIRSKRKNISVERDSVENKLMRFDILHSEANAVREEDKRLISKVLKDFHRQGLDVGIRYQRAYGSILSGDYFELVLLPDGESMFVFSDAKGHGLLAYTTLIRLRSAITLAVKDMRKIRPLGKETDTAALVKDIGVKFTDIMEESSSSASACVSFIFISKKNDYFQLKMYNRGMPFPIAVKPLKDGGLQTVNLNNPQPGWEPLSGSILGSDFRGLIGDGYFDLQECRYAINSGESLFFYSDGVSEAYDREGSEEFGEKCLESALCDCEGLAPQVAVDDIFDRVYSFIGGTSAQKDDMTAVFITFPFQKQQIKS